MNEKHQCAEKISGDWHYHGCPNTGKYEEDGKFWCGIHRPTAVAARRAKHNAKRERDSAIWHAGWTVGTRRKEFTETARQYVRDAINDKPPDLSTLVVAHNALETAEAELAKLKEPSE